MLRSSHICAALALVAAVAAAPGSARAGLPYLVATDNANTGGYSAGENGWPGTNGGSGYNPWTILTGDISGGGTYMENSGRQVDGSQSFALYAGTGGFDISRPLATPQTGLTEFDITTRFDLAGANFNLVNLRNGNGNTFGSGELLSFGIVNGNELGYTDASGLQTLPTGEARGNIWNWSILLNPTTGIYSASVNDGGTPFTFGGDLELSGTTLNSFAVANDSTGSSQNLIFDSPIVSTTPEPTSLGLLGLGAMGMLIRRRARS